MTASPPAPLPGRLLVGVMTCPANRDRETAVRRSWAARRPPGIALLFVEGGGSEPAPRLAGDRLILPVEEAYEFLPGKTRAFFRWAIAHTACEHILKCDDDSYVDLDMVSSLGLEGIDYAGRLTPPVPGIVETWHIAKCRDRAHEVPFGGPFPDLFAEGFAYFVSRAAAACVAAADDAAVGKHILEDVFVGWCIAGDGNRLARRDLSDLICARRHIWEERPGAYARHPLEPAEMSEAQRRFGRRPKVAGAAER